MARYRVNTRLVFSGVFEVEADSRTEARELVMKECGLVMGGSIRTTLDDEEVDWDFDIHPETEIGRITIKRN